MTHTPKIEKISVFDRINASALMLLTSEYKSLEQLRRKNDYPMFPTFERHHPCQ